MLKTWIQSDINHSPCYLNILVCMPLLLNPSHATAALSGNAQWNAFQDLPPYPGNLYEIRILLIQFHSAVCVCVCVFPFINDDHAVFCSRVISHEYYESSSLILGFSLAIPLLKPFVQLVFSSRMWSADSHALPTRWTSSKVLPSELR